MSKITIYSPPATAQIKACAVDFDLRRAPVPVHLVQYDKTIPILAVSLYKGSSPYTLPADAEVNVRMNKRNNLCVYNPALGCNESRDMVYVAVTPQMTTQDGTFEPILEVVINSGVAGTSPLQLVIRRNPVQEDAIEDTSEAKTLTKLVSQAAASATAAAQSASAAAEDAGNAAASATAAADTAKNIKDSLDQIAENTAAVSKLKEDTAALKDGKISKFYASSQGDTNLPDSDAGRIMDLKLYGKSEQKQYSGKNLLEDGSLKSDNNGKIEYIAAGKIKVTASASTWYSVITNMLYLTPDTNYVLSAKCDSLNGRIVCNSVIGAGTNIKCAFLTDSDGLATIDIRCRYESDESRFVYYDLQLEKGSTATGWEPYVGGIPSPNPEYPQEIKSVVKPRVKVTNQNYLNYVDIGGGHTAPITLAKGDHYLTRFFLTANTEVNNGVEYLINETWKRISALGSFENGKIVVSDGTFGWYSEHMKITCPEGITIRVSTTDNTAITLNDYGYLDKYAEYQAPQTATLPYTLNAIPVTSGGNVTIDGQQYVADYVDVERGKLVRMCKEVDFENVEQASYINELTKSREARYIASVIGIKAMLQSTPNNEAGFITSIRRLNPDQATWDLDEVGVWQCGQSEDRNVISIRIPVATTAAEYFKSIGGCKGVFQAAAPTETDLTADEIAAFKSLVSYYPVTNVSTTSDQLDGYTVFNYPISLANGWNYVKQQLGDTRDYLYGIDLMTAEAYVNSEYAAALAEIEV